MRKKPEERKKEILDAADWLFAQKGYDNTSTNDILEVVGIARGALYHHFKSKEEIMNSLIERYSIHGLEAAKILASDQSIPIKERLVQAMMAPMQAIMTHNAEWMGGAEVMHQVHQPQNALMHEKMQRATIGGIPPILTIIIQDGIEKGIFHTEYPYECMEMLVIYINTIFDNDIITLTGSEKYARLLALLSNMEKLLGAEPGSLMDLSEIFRGEMNTI